MITNLPDDILVHIARKLDKVSVVRLRSTCTVLRASSGLLHAQPVVTAVAAAQLRDLALFQEIVGSGRLFHDKTDKAAELLVLAAKHYRPEAIARIAALVSADAAEAAAELSVNWSPETHNNTTRLDCILAAYSAIQPATDEEGMGTLSAALEDMVGSEYVYARDHLDWFKFLPSLYSNDRAVVIFELQLFGNEIATFIQCIGSGAKMERYRVEDDTDSDLFYKCTDETRTLRRLSGHPELVRVRSKFTEVGVWRQLARLGTRFRDDHEMVGFVLSQIQQAARLGESMEQLWKTEGLDKFVLDCLIPLHTRLLAVETTAAVLESGSHVWTHFAIAPIAMTMMSLFPLPRASVLATTASEWIGDVPAATAAVRLVCAVLVKFGRKCEPPALVVLYLHSLLQFSDDDQAVERAASAVGRLFRIPPAVSRFDNLGTTTVAEWDTLLVGCLNRRACMSSRCKRAVFDALTVLPTAGAACVDRLVSMHAPLSMVRAMIAGVAQQHRTDGHRPVAAGFRALLPLAQRYVGRHAGDEEARVLVASVVGLGVAEPACAGNDPCRALRDALEVLSLALACTGDAVTKADLLVTMVDARIFQLFESTIKVTRDKCDPAKAKPVLEILLALFSSQVDRNLER
ncbi:hypothetical protein BC828DRAFT_405466 [Blastocladiella britannica]|nr:hypothetical protein BC828DRAFT_405466 [Blastocladiella britannica]